MAAILVRSFKMKEHKLSKETRISINDDETVTITKKLPLGPKGRMLEFSFPLTAEEWESLQSVVFNQDAISPQCAECSQFLHNCECKPVGRKRKKVVVSDALLAEFDKAAEEWKQWEEEEE
jgi:hypothetical protein